MARLGLSVAGVEREIDEATPADVVAAVEALDGGGEIALGDPAGIWLGIAGGPQRYFVAFADHARAVALQARADGSGDEPLNAVIGGQPTAIPAMYAVGRETATAAALHFLATGQADPAIAWEQM